MPPGYDDLKSSCTQKSHQILVPRLLSVLHKPPRWLVIITQNNSTSVFCSQKNTALSLSDISSVIRIYLYKLLRQFARRMPFYLFVQHRYRATLRGFGKFFFQFAIVCFQSYWVPVLQVSIAFQPLPLCSVPRKEGKKPSCGPAVSCSGSV